MPRATALVLLHVAVVLFGVAALFGKWIALPPVAIVAGRTVVAALTLAIVLGLRGASSGRPDAGLAANGVLLAIHWVAFFAAVQIGTVAIGLLGFASFPIFVLILESAQQRQRPRLSAALAVGLVAAGLVLLIPEFAWSNRSQHALALGVLSGFTFALLTLRNRARVARQGATALALWQNAFAAVCLIPAVTVLDYGVVPSLHDAILLILLGVFCTAVAHTLFIAAMARLSAHTASVVSVLEPVYGIALAALLLGERPDARTLVGALLIVGAAALATRAARND